MLHCLFFVSVRGGNCPAVLIIQATVNVYFLRGSDDALFVDL
jgi:hypothetical protein